MNGKVVSLHRWEVFEFFWGTGVKERRANKWIKLYLKPDGQEIDVRNRKVILHQNGIEFVD